ncbi:MAG: hypothetical protein V4717_08500 [Bacteroidota bacterium]
MKNNFNLDDLEDFLSDSAEQHRMYPSDKVWRNIDKELHGNKKWPALTFAAFLTGALITAGLILIHPDKNLFTVENANSANSPVTPTNETAVLNQLEKETSAGAKIIPLNSSKRNANVGINSEPFAQIQEDVNNSTVGEPVIQLGEKTSATFSDVAEESATQPQILQNSLVGSDESQLEIPEDANLQKGSVYTSTDILEINRTSRIDAAESAMSTIPEATSIGLKPVGLNSIDGNAKDVSAGLKSQKNAKLNLLFYIAPSISYRFLSEAKVVDLHQQNGPLAPNITHGVNNFVTHKPIAGFELGAGISYNLSSSVRIRTGLQANLRGYSIDAYASPRRETSTIVLNRGFYNDSLIAMSSISTQDGYKQMHLTNRYFELSIPVSMDMRVANWKKLQVYVAAGLQPTYQFNKSMYIVSSDYKNYVQEPGLVRAFNMNTNLEAFMSYKAGGVTWQVGPQIRYQLLPGAKTEYPVRERLIDYGFKIGVVKTLK